jgi:hypothetical protein
MPEHPRDPAELPESFRHLPLKQQRVVLQDLASGGNASEAVRQAGYSASAATEQGYENLRKPRIRAALADLLPLNGITDARTLRRLFERLQASKRSVKYDEKRGHWAYSRREPDHATRLHAADLALKLQGAYPKEGHTPGSYTLIISHDTDVSVHPSEAAPLPAATPGTPAGEQHQRGHLVLELPVDPSSESGSRR